MEKIGVADYGIYAWSGGFYDYSERIERVGAIGFDGLERLYPTSAEDALQKASNLKKMKMDFATCNAENPELAIRWTAALGGKYVWAEVMDGDFDAYVRRVREMTRVANRYGIDVAVHNHLGQTVETQEEIEEFLRECPQTKLLFDVGHLAVAGGDVEYIASTYYDRIVAYHLKGWQQSQTPDAAEWWKRGFFCGIGQGNVPVCNEFVYKNAVKRNFDGWVFIEQDTHQRDPYLDLEESYALLQKWRKEV